MDNIRTRDIRLDGLKFILIVLVILGHSINVFGLEKDAPTQYIFQWIYLFHMPLFALLSGYFVNSTKNLKKILIGEGKLLETYALCQLLIFFSLIFPSGDFTFRNILSPSWSLWYLFSLIIWRFITFLTPSKLQQKPLILIFLSISISLLVGFIDKNQYAFQRIFTYFPFFLMGMYLKKYDFFKRPYTKRHVILSAIFASIIFLILCFLDIKDVHFLYHEDPYSQSNFPLFWAIAWRALWYPLSFLLSLAFLPLLFSSVRPWMSLYGQNSLFLYVGHAVLFRYLIELLYFRGLSELLTDSIKIISSIICFIVTISLLCWIINKGYNQFMTNPFSTIRGLKTSN